MSKAKSYYVGIKKINYQKIGKVLFDDFIWINEPHEGTIRELVEYFQMNCTPFKERSYILSIIHYSSVFSIQDNALCVYVANYGNINENYTVYKERRAYGPGFSETERYTLAFPGKYRIFYIKKPFVNSKDVIVRKHTWSDDEILLQDSAITVTMKGLVLLTTTIRFK